MAYVFAPGWKLKEVQARIEAYAAQESSADNADACDAIKNLQQQLEEDQTKSAALQKRVEELEEALSNIGCRTDRGDQPEPCPICAIVDAALKAKE
jgi:DNA repair exonuclease SbcCD ATPase subunit